MESYGHPHPESVWFINNVYFHEEFTFDGISYLVGNREANITF